MIVLDASAAVRAVLEPGVPRWSAPLETASLVLAPDLLPAEAANAFWKYVRAGVLTRSDAEIALRNAIALVDEFRPVHELALEALGLGLLMERPVYDMVYLVLARRHAAALLTADKGLQAAANRAGVRIATDL